MCTSTIVKSYHPTARAVSHLTHLAWENVMTSVTCGARVCSRPLTSYTVCGQLAAVQRTRRQCVLPWQAKQTTKFMALQSPGTKTVRSHTQCHPHCLPGIGLHQSINQASKTNIYSAIFRKRFRR